ncbi:MAG: helix-turn-helix transcriptional regulator [Lachnospiraceae bacterium]|nr:helix-turn-helix transcriptional regulator [Lachnospiraceae bacterium]
MIDILDRITSHRISRNWTEYQLAQKSGIPQSTISTWYRKKMLPTLSSLDKICRAFDMTMAQFLSENDGLTEITPDQRELLDKWELLSPIQKKAFLILMDSIAL